MSNNRPESVEPKAFDPDKVGIFQLMGSLRIPDVIATVTVLASVVGGAYQLGVTKEESDNKLEIYEKDSEINDLRKKLTEVQEEAQDSASKTVRYKYQMDEKDTEISDLRKRIAEAQREIESTASRSLNYKYQVDQRDSEITTLSSKITDLENALAQKPKDTNTQLFTGPTKPDGYVMNADEIGVNYWEYNHRVFYPSTLTVCRESCRIDTQCLAFTFTGTENDGTCYLKPAITGRTTGGPNTLVSATKGRSR
ncbi:MAG: hypothetical protein JO223_10580 [Hyphomicrobiales bacterium]|nr:hypothetical protein [Hyphomicrobiales bacterium]